MELYSQIYLPIQLFYSIIMLYAIPLSALFGGAMYYAGRNGFLQNIDQETSKKQGLKANPEPQKESSLAQKNLTPPTVASNTFTDSAITAPIRNIKMNDYCNIIYSTDYKCPISVHEYLNLSIITGDAPRTSFFPDKNIEPEKFAVKDNFFTQTKAFEKLNINRGHMAAASNYSSSVQLKKSTFSFANVVPQNGKNNGGIWNTFQRYARSLLKQKKCQTIQIISGPIFNSDTKHEKFDKVYRNQYNILMKNGTAIPPRLYKIIKCNSGGKSYASGFTFLNTETSDNQKKLSQFEEKIDEIENATGLVFNLKNGLTGNLSTYDSQGLSKTKQAYDLPFFESLFTEAETIKSMNDVLRRAYSQQINLYNVIDSLQGKITKQAQKQIQDILKNQSLNYCGKSLQSLYLYRNLYYIGLKRNKFSKVGDQITNKADSLTLSCGKSPSEQEKTKILGLLKNKNVFKVDKFGNLPNYFSTAQNKAE